MNLAEYQERAMTTCLSASENFLYMFLNLVGEAGEVSSKVGKLIRKGKIEFSENKLIFKDFSDSEKQEFLEDMKKELGDVLWQLSGTCTVLGFSLEEVAKINLDKLASRKARGVVDGNGDNR